MAVFYSFGRAHDIREAAQERRPTQFVFLTVCAEKRGKWLAQASVQRALHEIWQHTATAWLVSDYLLMPDHLHLFCAPHDLKFTIERWIGFWNEESRKSGTELNIFFPAFLSSLFIICLARRLVRHSLGDGGSLGVGAVSFAVGAKPDTPLLRSCVRFREMKNRPGTSCLPVRSMGFCKDNPSP